MKSTWIIVILSAATVSLAQPQKKASPFAGRWDLTVTTPQQTYPSWMEVTDDANIRVVGRVASVHPVQEIKMDGAHLTFTSSESFNGKNIPVSWEMSVAGGKITGKQKRSDGVEGAIAGVPAPALKRKEPAAWTQPEPLFNGKDLSGWENDDAAKANWEVQNGELVNAKKGGNIRSTRKLSDFKLHIEYNCPERGNSGVYLRGRYEVQVEYEASGANDPAHSMGSIYGFFAPSTTLPKKPGQWESYDVTLVGRTVTVVRDGVTIIDHQEIPGITGGAIDSHEGEPGVIYMQGDHTGGMKYRNITVALPK